MHEPPERSYPCKALNGLSLLRSTTDRTPNSSRLRTATPPAPSRARGVAAAWLLCMLATVHGAHAATVPTDFVDELVVGGLNAPVNSATMADGRLLFVEQYSHKVRMMVGDQLAAIDPVGTVPEVRSQGESGLIGVATDPRWPTHPYVYVMANHEGSQSVRIWRFRMTGDLTRTGNGAMSFDPASRYTVLEALPDLSPSHQAGSLRFGNDGKLFVATGDDEQNCVALDVTSPLGKILRIDVSTLPDGPGGPPALSALAPNDNPFASNPNAIAKLVWARGLRNPYMTSFDPVTNTLVVGDVGSQRWEELDLIETGGLNYGWPMWEGPDRTGFPCAGADSSLYTPPSYAYAHIGVGYAVFGGPIYREPAGATRPFPNAYEGSLFFGDTWRGFIRRLDIHPNGSTVADSVPGQPDAQNWAVGPKWPTAMSIAPDGSLLYFLIYRTQPTSGEGELRRIRYVAPKTDAGDPPLADLANAAVLDAPFPVPSNGAIELGYRLARPSSVRLAIYDARGRTIRTLLDARAGLMPAGAGRATWDGRDAQGRLAPAGVYFARLDAGDQHSARRFVRLAAP